MAVLSKILRHPGSHRQSILLLLAAILVFRSAFLPNKKTNNNTANSIAFPSHSQPDLASDARFFPLHPQQRNEKSKLSLSFWQQFRSLLRIVIPSIHSHEALLLLAHSSFLVLRTVLSVAVAKLDGRIVRDLVSADGYGFLRGLALWFALAVPSIYTNSMVRRTCVPAEMRAHPSPRFVIFSPSFRSALGDVSLATYTTSTSPPHLIFVIIAFPFRASTSISQPMLNLGVKVSLAYSMSPVPSGVSHDLTCIQWEFNETFS